MNDTTLALCLILKMHIRLLRRHPPSRPPADARRTAFNKDLKRSERLPFTVTLGAVGPTGLQRPAGPHGPQGPRGTYWTQGRPGRILAFPKLVFMVVPPLSIVTKLSDLSVTTTSVPLA